MSDLRAVEEIRNAAGEFRSAFAHPIAQKVLMRLASFCKAGQSPAPEKDGEPLDRDRMLILIGRQQVWLQIQRMLHLQPSELFRLYAGRDVHNLSEAKDDEIA